MRKIMIIGEFVLACGAGGIAAAQTVQATGPQTAAKGVSPTPEPSATAASEPAGKSISEPGIKGPAPDRPKPRPTPKPGVKFGQE